MSAPWFEERAQAEAETDVITPTFDEDGNPVRRFPKPTFDIPEQRKESDG